MRISVLLISLAVAATTACGPLPPINDYTSPPVVQSTAAASIRITASSRSDQKLDITAEVLTVAGKPVAGAAVTFAATSGTLTPTTATTDADGYARTIASAAWQNTVSASTSGLVTSWKVEGAAPVTVTPTSNNPTSPVSPPITSTPTPSVTPAAPAPGPLAVAIYANTMIYEDEETLMGVSLPVSGFTPRVVSWNFGDGASTTANNFSPRHTYADPGTYTVTLNIADDLGRTANATKVVTVLATPVVVTPTPVAPSLVITASCTNVTPLTVSCPVALSFNGTSVAGRIDSITWTWGDGAFTPRTPVAPATTVSNLTAEHTYAARGTYSISVTLHLTTGENATTTFSYTF